MVLYAKNVVIAITDYKQFSFYYTYISPHTRQQHTVAYLRNGRHAATFKPRQILKRDGFMKALSVTWYANAHT